ncbi:MAG: hypothetical protein WCI56_04955 [Hyphomicrobiales bacterium]
MADSREAVSSPRGAFWCRLAAMLLAVAAAGLPVNHLFGYAPLLVAAVLIFAGEMTASRGRWLAAVAVVAAAVLLRILLTPQPVQEGHNIFVPGDPAGVLEKQLPPDVYRFMKTEFDARYPAAQRCDPKTPGCWQAGPFPDRAFAFSADGILAKPAYSRTVSEINFSDAVWLRLGFINEQRYNWSGDGALERGQRDRRFWMGWQRWHVTLPWFVMYQFPANYTGAELCWRGDVLWEGANQRYEILRHAETACRAITGSDIGRKIFGVSVKPDSLIMKLNSPLPTRAQLIARDAASLLAIAGLLLLLLLVRVRWRDTVQPAALIALALAVIVIDDASFIGGWRPFDGGDDGLFYSGVGRTIVQDLMRGDFTAALIGGERVYYYGGPGLRYFRALEMIAFGDTNLGYLSLVLAMPIVVYSVFKRFLTQEVAWPLVVVFTALPLGEIFGTSFFHYAKWAARGFADSAAHILFLSGMLVIAGVRRPGPTPDAAPAFGGALLLALAVFVKPIIAPMVGILLGGAGLAALWQQQWRRIAGMCAGFLPVLLMPLHNWHYGHELVLFSSNSGLPASYTMPPSAYISALGEILRLDFGGEHVQRGLAQIAGWLSGPGDLLFLAPLNAAAVGVVIFVAFWGRGYDPWLRLIAGATLAEHVTAMIYIPTPRYFYVMWLLTAVIVAEFLARAGPGWWRRRLQAARA